MLKGQTQEKTRTLLSPEFETCLRCFWLRFQNCTHQHPGGRGVDNRARKKKKTININIFGGTVSGTNGTRPRDKMGPLPGTKWDPSLGQTGLPLFNSTVKSPFCPVCPWDGWGFVPGDDCPARAVRKMLMCFLFIGFLLPKTSDASSENVRSINVLTFLSHHNMVKNNKAIPLSSDFHPQLGVPKIWVVGASLRQILFRVKMSIANKDCTLFMWIILDTIRQMFDFVGICGNGRPSYTKTRQTIVGHKKGQQCN